jgi:hypothetical protein
MNLNRPPEKGNSRFDDWMFLMWKFITKADSGIVETNHAALGNLNSTNYSHLTANQKTDLTDLGDSTLHYHATDRNRANHTGVQPASSISDFEQSIRQITGPLEAQIFGK